MTYSLPTMAFHTWEIAEYVQLWRDHGIEELSPEIELLLAHELSREPAPSLPQAFTQLPELPSVPSKLEELQRSIQDCKLCRLCEGRSQIVFGTGNAHSRLMFVGEAPGADEDQTGMPFVGRAGQLLDKIIAAMGFKREEVYIANVIKCRPPENRAPLPDEIDTCGKFLREQIAAVQPDVIVALGSPASAFLTGKNTSMGTLRGHFNPLAFDIGKPVRVMSTYHPAYLLSNPVAKGVVWDDMKKVIAHLGESK